MTHIQVQEMTDGGINQLRIFGTDAANFFLLRANRASPHWFHLPVPVESP